MPIHRNLNRDFFKTWSPEMAYVLGYFAADGSMLTNKRGAHFIEWTSIDRLLVYQIRNVFGSNHTITVRKRGGNANVAYRLQIGSREWFTDLTKLGFTQNKSNVLAFPAVPKEYLGDFVRGYFDGDGCVYLRQLQYADRKKKRWVLLTLFTSGSQNFLVSLHAVLKKHGVIGGSVKRKTRGFELVFSHRDSLALYRFMYHTAQAGSLCLLRKRKKLEQAVRVLKFEDKVRS